jgi:hypothetical protein
MRPMTELCRWDTQGRALDCPAYADPRSKFGYCAAHAALVKMALEFRKRHDRQGFDAAARWAIDQECDPAALAKFAKQIARGHR